MKIAERIIIVALLLAIIGLGAWLYFAVQYEEAELRDAVASGAFEIREEASTTPGAQSEAADTAAWREWFPQTIPIMIGGVSVQASVADSMSERIKGLSDTPYMPEDIVKLFAFGSPGEHSIWMKNMNYSLDIIWVAKEGQILHIEENVSPDSYPTSFKSPVPAWFVVETNAGFVGLNSISVGDEVVLPVTEAPRKNELLTPEIEAAAQ